MNQVSRRSFLKNSGGAGIALWLGISTWDNAAKASNIYEAKNFTPYIIVDSGGSITLFNTKPEMGQGTFQSIPALIAEEFEVSFDQIIIQQSNGESAFGPNQRAGGSASIRTSYSDLRKVGASAREVFIKAASMQWQVDVSSCYAENGKVFHKTTNRSLTYGELVLEASKLDLSKDPKLKDPKDFKILGKMASRPDVPLKTCGKAEFGIDVRLPDMLYASVERCPVIGGTLKSFDATEALKIPGVEKVAGVERVIGRYHSVGVAVIANSYWTALQARKKLKIEWDTAAFESFNTTEYEDHLRALASQEGLPDKNIGSVDSLHLQPQNTIEAFYETPMEAHHPLETLNCVAQVRGDQVEIWVSTQVPSNVTGTGEFDLHKYIGVTPENIRMHTKFIGGGFGRRLYFDFIVEAVNIARLTVKPVKLIWSREDATEQGPFRPMTFSQLKGGFSDDGKLLAFQHKVIGPSLMESRDGIFDKTKVDSSMVEGIGVQAYEFPNLKTSYVRSDFHIPVASWRSVTSSTVAFPPECFLDELAYKAKKDPMEFRLELLSKPSDAKRVLLKLKEMSHWDEPLPKGRGRGVAQWEFFAGLGGQVVEVTYRPDKSIKIDKIYAIIDLGEVVNPDNVINQVQGAIVMALGAATKPGITFKNGKVEQHNFYDDLLVRMYEVPEIEVAILAEGGKVKGVGEPGLPPFAPALANAIFAATGKRIRKMPFALNNI